MRLKYVVVLGWKIFVSLKEQKDWIRTNDSIFAKSETSSHHTATEIGQNCGLVMKLINFNSVPQFVSK